MQTENVPALGVDMTSSGSGHNSLSLPSSPPIENELSDKRSSLPSIGKRELLQAWREDKNMIEVSSSKISAQIELNQESHAQTKLLTSDESISSNSVEESPLSQEYIHLVKSPRNSKTNSVPNEIDLEKEYIKEQLRRNSKLQKKKGSERELQTNNTNNYNSNNNSLQNTMENNSNSLSPKPKKQVGNYQLGEVLGRGATGVVYKGLNMLNGEFVAIKQVAKSKLKNKETINRELKILKQITHANIVKVIDSIETATSINLVLELIESNITDILNKFGAFPETLASIYTYQILLGLKCLHDEGIFHRDLKSNNILLTKDGVIKLSDFGVAIKETDEEENNENNGIVTTPYWSAPEVIQTSVYYRSSDIWSLGCTVIELVSCVPPYFELNAMTAMYRIVDDLHPPLPSPISPELHNFLLLCFEKDPSKRITAKELLNHSWIQQSTKTKIHVNKPIPLPLKSFEDLRDALIEYNQNNKERIQTLRNYKKREESIDYELLLVNSPLNNKNNTEVTSNYNSNNNTISAFPKLERKFSESQRKTLSLSNSIGIHKEEAKIMKEGYLKSKYKYWCIIQDNLPLLFYYKKKEKYEQGKSPKGQIMLIGSEVSKSQLIKKEPYAFIIQQRDGKRYYLSADSEEEQIDWIQVIKQVDTFNVNNDLAVVKQKLKEQEEYIIKLQQGIRSLLNEKDGNNRGNIKRPNEQFYKEFFFFIALSVKRNKGSNNSIVTEEEFKTFNIQALYDTAQREHIPFHTWYEWIPAQMSSNNSITTKSSKT